MVSFVVPVDYHFQAMYVEHVSVFKVTNYNRYLLDVFFGIIWKRRPGHGPSPRHAPEPRSDCWSGYPSDPPPQNHTPPRFFIDFFLLRNILCFNPGSIFVHRLIRKERGRFWIQGPQICPLPAFLSQCLTSCQPALRIFPRLISAPKYSRSFSFKCNIQSCQLVFFPATILTSQNLSSGHSQKKGAVCQPAYAAVPNLQARGVRRRPAGSQPRPILPAFFALLNTLKPKHKRWGCWAMFLRHS